MNTKKEWYIRIDEKTEGPFSVLDLYVDNRLTPNTLAWRSGMAYWQPVKEIPELAAMFIKKQKDEEQKEASQFVEGDEGVLILDYEPQSYFLLIVLVTIFILFIMYFFFS